MKAFFASLLMFLCISVANATNLAIGAVNLSLGMEQALALKQLSSLYKVVDQPLMAHNSYTVVAGKDASSKLLGIVTFSEGKLKWASRNWGMFNFSDSSVVYANTLFAVIEAATTASGSTAVISTKITRAPDLEVKNINFVFADRKISVLISEDKNYGRQANISEIIGN